jgi:hypothetical protein
VLPSDLVLHPKEVARYLRAAEDGEVLVAKWLAERGFDSSDYRDLVYASVAGSMARMIVSAGCAGDLVDFVCTAYSGALASLVALECEIESALGDWCARRSLRAGLEELPAVHQLWALTDVLAAVQDEQEAVLTRIARANAEWVVGEEQKIDQAKARLLRFMQVAKAERWDSGDGYQAVVKRPKDRAVEIVDKSEAGAFLEAAGVTGGAVREATIVGFAAVKTILGTKAFGSLAREYNRDVIAAAAVDILAERPVPGLRLHSGKQQVLLKVASSGAVQDAKVRRAA